MLADHPKIGPAGLIPGTRRFVVKPYILTVRQRDGVVEIAAIRHAKQSDAYTPHEAMEDDETDELIKTASKPSHRVMSTTSC